ncbi:MAG: PEP/pyruvate-binding domain-containing protein, partial [Gemmatimonadales bacterium]
MKNVFFFGDGKADGNAAMADVLGGKGANLAEMTNIGVRVPPGFTISAKLCTEYIESGELDEFVRREVQRAMDQLEEAAGRKFGDAADPLLVSVRSGSQVSMPGMMDTILNLGLNDSTVAGIAAQSGNERFAWDSYRRFIQMYSDVVFDIAQSAGDTNPFDTALDSLKRERGVESDADLASGDMKDLVTEFKAIVERETDAPFPDDPWVQLWGAIEAVFHSWNTQRAIDYRRVHNIPDNLGTAVNVVAMVYGNMGNDSGTGVVFTRDPSTGENRLFGEFLINAQGEDVVAGIRTPQTLTLAAKEADGSTLPALEEVMPE